MADIVKYRAHVTDRGREKILAALAEGKQVQITHMAAGDGGGSTPAPTGAVSQLTGNEVWRGPVDSVSVETNDPHILIVDATVPITEGGFFVREYACYDADGDMIAFTPAPEIYKAVPEEGAMVPLRLILHIAVDSAEAVEIVVSSDPNSASKQDIDALRGELAAHDASATAHQGALGAHNTDGAAHPDIRALLGQGADAAVSAHNSAADAHPNLRQDLTGKADLAGAQFTGEVSAANPAPETLAVRNISAGTEDLTPGVDSLPTGAIYLVYE